MSESFDEPVVSAARRLNVHSGRPKPTCRRNIQDQCPPRTLSGQAWKNPCLLRLCGHAGAPGLDRFDLGLSPREPPEPTGQLATVEDLTLGRLDRSQRLAGRTTNGSADGGERWPMRQGAVLLGLGTVCHERVGQGARRRFGVGMCRMINIR